MAFVLKPHVFLEVDTKKRITSQVIPCTDHWWWWGGTVALGVYSSFLLSLRNSGTRS